jgi:tetratricopeptide (TPR) repeat protein
MPTSINAQRTRKTTVVAYAILLLFSLALCAPPPARATQGAQQDEERERAFELFANQRFIEALPLFEKLSLKYPRDGEVITRHGFTIFANAQTNLKDPAQRAKERARARATLLRARDELGVKNDLLEQVVAAIPPDGSESASERFSENKEADEAMRAGESAFTKGKLDEAVKFYERALQLDPKLYEAPLFAGDLLTKKQEWDKAGEWFARAIAINPERETAYRYWGDSYLHQARLDEARDKFIEAVIADPYNGYVWRNGLAGWANRKGVHLGHPKIDVPTSVTPMKDNKMTITIDPKTLEKSDDGRAAWMWYGLTRAVWTTKEYEKFKKEYPGEKAYRHSLGEEADALRHVIEAVREQTKKGEVKKLSPDLEQLLKLDGEGLLEAHILFARADDGVARDYAAYRKSNRDKLRRYLLEYVASGKY